MRNYLEINDDIAENSYCGIIQAIWKKMNLLIPDTEEGFYFIEDMKEKFKSEIDNNQAPIMLIGGTEAKEKYNEFYGTDEVVYNFGKFVSDLIKSGGDNLLINLCAEEHYLNTGSYPEYLEFELSGSDDDVIGDIIDDKFYGLNSQLYEKIKADYIDRGLITIDTNKKTYIDVINTIKDALINYPTDLIDDSKNYIESNITKIFESSTPVLRLKEFKTNAQQLIGDDKKFMDILKFIDKNIKESPSLNLLINIAKEEHLQNTGRANQPDSDETINKLKEYWSAGDSQIEDGIKSGIFDELKSNLMMQLRSDLIPDGKNKINKAPETIQDLKNVFNLNESHQNLQVFNPIGILVDDVHNNKKVAIVENDVLDVIENDNGYQFQTSNTQLTDLPDYEKLQLFNNALKSLSYNPTTNEFRPALDIWDFNIVINSDGDVLISDDYNTEPQIVDKSDLQELFSETINLLLTSDTIVDNTQHTQLLKDADNFILVANNFDKLVLFDDLIQLQGLDNQYAIVSSDSIPLNESEIDLQSNKELQFITGSQLKQSQKYSTYQELINNINKNIGINSESDVRNIFQQSINAEQNKKQKQLNQIEQLKSEQNKLNQSIKEKQNLLKIAMEDSPAADKLNIELQQLNENLDINLKKLDKLINSKK